MARLVKTLICLLLLCPEIQAQSATYDYSRVALYSGLSFDLTTTVMTKGLESNALLGQRPAQQVVTAVSLTALADVLSKKIKDSGHPKMATVFNFTFGSVHFGAGLWNVHLQSVRK